MGTVTITVGSALAGRQWTSIQSAIDGAVPENLVSDANSYVIEVYPEGNGADGEYVQSGSFLTLSSSSHVTSSTYTLTIKAATGSAWYEHATADINRIAYDKTKGVALRMTGTYASAMLISIPNVIIDGLQIKCDSSPSQSIAFNSSASNNTIQRCILQCKPGTTNYGVSLSGAGVNRLLNSVVIIDTSTAAACAVNLSNGSICVNNTIVRPKQYGNVGVPLLSSYGTAIVRNCAIFGFNAAAGSGIGGSYNTDGHNCTDFTSAPGSTGNITSATYANQFLNYNNAADAQNNNTANIEDFRLQATADCVNNGATATAYISSAIDALGTSRPQGAAWDIGAIEYKVVVATALTFSGPSTGYSGQASSNFTVGGNYSIVSDVVVTLGDSGAGGTWTPSTVTLTSVAPTATATYTAASNGAKTLTVTNNAGLTNAANLTFTASTPAVAPTAAITSIVVSGQSVTINLSTTNTPVSGLATLTATSGEATTVGPTALTLGSNTATVTWTGLLSGTYAIPTVTVTNSGGTNAASGGSIITIVGIDGQPEAGASQNPASIVISVPSASFVSVASSTITVTAANGAISGDVVITPSDGGSGVFTPSTVTINTGSPTATMTYTPATAGSKTISFTNNGGLTNPSSATCFANEKHTRKKTKGMNRYAGLLQL